MAGGESAALPWGERSVAPSTRATPAPFPSGPGAAACPSIRLAVAATVSPSGERGGEAAGGPAGAAPEPGSLSARGGVGGEAPARVPSTTVSPTGGEGAKGTAGSARRPPSGGVKCALILLLLRGSSSILYWRLVHPPSFFFTSRLGRHEKQGSPAFLHSHCLWHVEPRVQEQQGGGAVSWAREGTSGTEEDMITSLGPVATDRDG